MSLRSDEMDFKSATISATPGARGLLGTTGACRPWRERETAVKCWRRRAQEPPQKKTPQPISTRAINRR